MNVPPLAAARSLARIALRACGLAVCCALAPTSGQAAETQSWEYAPYRVQVWVAAPPRPEFPPALVDELADAFAIQSRLACGAAWQLSVAPLPAALRGELWGSAAVPPPERFWTLAPEAHEADKVILLRLASAAGELQVEAQEFDTRLRLWGSPVRRTTLQRDALPAVAWETAREAFSPVVRVEKVEGLQVVARARAGGLIVEEKSPARIDVGAVLRPVIRRNDRRGEPVKGGVQAVPWALLDVQARDDSLLTCTLHSGFRYAIPSRGGPRTERFAQLVVPRYEATELRLQTRGSNPQPLVGYELLNKDPRQGTAAPLGVTDWRGIVEVPRSGAALQVLYVRSGSQLLARLPLVPGAEPQAFASLPDDAPRLAAEAAVKTLQSRVMDLVARREIMAGRIRARIKEFQFPEAQALIEQFRQLETRGELARELLQWQQQVTSREKLTQDRIDQLFTSAQTLLNKYLDPRLADELAAELQRAQGASRTAGP